MGNKKRGKRPAPLTPGGVVNNVVDKVKDALGIQEEKEETPAETASKNRSTGQEIASELKSIRFGLMKQSDVWGDDAAETCEDMMKKRDAIVKVIENAPTISDQIEGIDAVMLYAARAWRTAIEKGTPRKAEWAMSALSTGALFLRENIPADHEDQRKEILNKRIKYMKKYENIIKTYEKIDYLEAEISKQQKTIDENMKKLLPFQTKLEKMLDTPEGRELYGKLKGNMDQWGNLTKEELEFATELRNNNNLYHTIQGQLTTLSGNQTELASANQEAGGFRIGLDREPMKFRDEEIQAAFLQELSEQRERLADQYASARALSDEVQKDIEARIVILQGADATALRGSDIAYMEMVQEQNLKVDRTGAQIGRQRYEKLKKMQTEKETADAEAAAFNEAFNASEDEEFNFQEEANAETAENTAEDENANQQYNWNT